MALPEDLHGGDCQAFIDAMESADPDLDPVWGLLVGGSAGSVQKPTCAQDEEAENCDAAILAMNATDPELDPVWGLLVGAGSGHTMDEEEQSKPVVNEHVVASDSSTAGFAELVESESVQSVDTEQQLMVPVGDINTSAKRISNVVDKAEASPSQFPVAPDVVSPSPTRRDIKGCDAYVLDGVLTKDECDALIVQSEGLWSFWDSESERPRVEFRNAHTIEVTHQELADRIWSRVSHLVNPTVSIQDGDERFEVDIEGDWKPYGINPTLLLSRYVNGGHFSPHTDGTTVVDFNRRTFYSCVLFLNSSPWGGHTRIYDDAQIGREPVVDSEGRLTGDPSLVLDAVEPAPGRMLFFYHRLMHEGVPAAEKYIIRTDVLYRREPEICTAPEDVEAFAMYEKAQLLAENGDCEGARKLFERCFKRSPALARVYRM